MQSRRLSSQDDDYRGEDPYEGDWTRAQESAPSRQQANAQWQQAFEWQQQVFAQYAEYLKRTQPGLTPQQVSHICYANMAQHQQLCWALEAKKPAYPHIETPEIHRAAAMWLEQQRQSPSPQVELPSLQVLVALLNVLEYQQHAAAADRAVPDPPFPPYSALLRIKRMFSFSPNASMIDRLCEITEHVAYDRFVKYLDRRGASAGVSGTDEERNHKLIKLYDAWRRDEKAPSARKSAPPSTMRDGPGPSRDSGGSDRTPKRSGAHQDLEALRALVQEVRPNIEYDEELLERMASLKKTALTRFIKEVLADDKTMGRALNPVKFLMSILKKEEYTRSTVK